MQTKEAIKFLIATPAIVVMLLFFTIDFVVVFDISRLILFLYAFVMCACLLSASSILLKPVRAVSILVLLFLFGLYIAMYNFIPEIARAHRIDACLDNGGTWNNMQNQCR